MGHLVCRKRRVVWWSTDSHSFPVRYWLLGDHVAVMGEWSREIDYRVSREAHLVSIAMADGAMVAHNLSLEPTNKADPAAISPRNDGGRP